MSTKHKRLAKLGTYTKGARITGERRRTLAKDVGKAYSAGATAREISRATGRSYGFCLRLVEEAGVPVRSRGGGYGSRSRMASQIALAGRVHEQQSLRRSRVKVGDPDVRREFSQALGHELRTARKRAGMTITTLIHCLDKYLTANTVGMYERGKSHMQVLTLLDMSDVLSVKPEEMLTNAIRRASLARNNLGLRVDLRAVLRGRQPEFAWTRRWAASRLRRDPSERTVELSPAAITELAHFVDADPDKVMEYLAQFAPRIVLPMA